MTPTNAIYRGYQISSPTAGIYQFTIETAGTRNWQGTICAAATSASLHAERYRAHHFNSADACSLGLQHILNVECHLRADRLLELLPDWHCSVEGDLQARPLVELAASLITTSRTRKVARMKTLLIASILEFASYTSPAQSTPLEPHLTAECRPGECQTVVIAGGESIRTAPVSGIVAAETVAPHAIRHYS